METESAIEHAEEMAHSGAGLPQLDPSTYPNQLFWLVVSLVAIYFILTRVAMPRISSVLADRSSQITNDLTAAEELKQKAHDAEAAYEKSLAEAHAEAQKIAEAKRNEIKAKTDAEMAKADAEIAARAAESEKVIAGIRDSALDSVREVAKDTASNVLVALGGNADAKAVAKAVDDRLKG